MSVEIKTKLSIQTCDGKKTWNIPEEFVVSCDGAKYIKVPRRHHGFMVLVMHGCTSLPEKRCKNFSLSASKGYQKLLDLRTKAQQAHEEAKDRRLTEVQSLFKCKVKNKKPKVSRSESKFTKEFPEALQLLVDMPDGSQLALKVLKEFHHRGDIYVELDKLVISGLIDFLQHSGWDQSIKRIKLDTDISEEVEDIEAISGSSDSPTSNADGLCTDTTSLTIGSVGG